MSVGVDVITELFTAVKSTLITAFNDYQIAPVITFHSDVDITHNASKYIVYVSHVIAREEQDTLCVNVTDIGRIRYTSTGVLQVSFFAPRAEINSYKIMTEVAQNLKNQLRKTSFKCALLRNITASPYNTESNSYRYELTATFTYDEII